MTNLVNKSRLLKAHKILFAFKRRHQLVAHLLDVLEMAEGNVTLKNIVGTEFACPLHLAVIQMAVNQAQMGQPGRGWPKLQRFDVGR